MPLTPIDVQQKTFRVALRGYAEDEVDEFLDEIVLSIREYEQRLEEMSFQVGALESQLAENRQTEEAMRRTLVLAEKTADEIKEEARREAEKTVSDARLEASSLSAEQSDERVALMGELRRLRDIVGDVQGRLADVAIDTQARLEPVAADIDHGLEANDDADESDEESAHPGGLFAVDGGSSEEAWVDDSADTPDDDTSGTSFWDGDEGPAPEDVTGDDPMPDSSSDDGGFDEHQPEGTGFDLPPTDDVGEVAEDVSNDVASHADDADLPDGVDDAVDQAVDQVRDTGSRRRPWERFGD